jgi:serine/threonine protein kinase
MSAQSHFGKYQILEKLAEGRFSSIYKARLEGIGGFHRLFAIKRLPKALSNNKNYMDRLIEEAKLAGLLSHANIVQILDLGRIDDSYYIAMEYINGRDLGSVLKRCRSKSITFPLPHALFTILEALKGLEYAHQRKVLRGGRPVPLNLIHRGISPSNILMSLQGEVKITDFGLSRARQTIGPPSNLRLSYMSPEQIKGGAVDFRSDIYTLGVVLYEMLCGAHPFLKHNEKQTHQGILDHKLKPPSAVNADVPFSLEIILEQALAADPEERFQTAAAFKESIEGFFHDAGFIFSHSTLAAFLKGLFPPKALQKNQGLATQETRPLHKDFPLIDDESEEIPTSLNNIDLLDLPTDSAEYAIATAQPLDTSVSSTSASFGPSSSANDDSTLILRPSPDREPISNWMDQTRVDSTDDHTQARAKLSEEQTSVRAIPQKNQKQAPPDQDATIRLEKSAQAPPPVLPAKKSSTAPTPIPTLIETAPFPLPDYEVSLSGPLPVKPPQAPGDSANPAPSNLNSRMPVILAATLLLGLGAGIILGKKSSSAPPGETLETTATVRHPPKLQISGPEGTQIKEGDRSYSIDASGMAEMTLEPNENTTIRITAEGFRPTDYRYTPRENGIRKLILEWKELTPTR